MSDIRYENRRKNSHIDILLSKSKEELVKIILEKEEHNIPLSVLNSGMHPLQATVKYLKEEEGLEIKEISILLNRNIQTIWTSYRIVKNEKILFEKNGTKIPLSILSKDKNSILESTINYLHTVHNIPLGKIATLLGKSIKTIWTCNNRYQKKNHTKHYNRNNHTNILGGKK